MFVFYDMKDLLVMHSLQILKRLSDSGFQILVSDLKLQDYTNSIINKVHKIQEAGYLKIKEADVSCVTFALENKKKYKQAGKGLLGLIAFCKMENVILVIDESENDVALLAKSFSVIVYTMDEFNNATINNPEYFEFMNEIKKQSRLMK